MIWVDYLTIPATTGFAVNYHHFIITRFNVNITSVDFPQRLGNTWLSLRFELFQKYCFPTIQAQENQSFTWLVLFDEQTPARFRPLINAFSQYNNFVPLFCGDYKSIMPSVVERMQELAPDAEWFLTTRLDNDDALSIHFVRCLQEVVGSLTEPQLKPSDTLFINFPNGLQLCDGQFYDFKDATNAFVSLIERPEAPQPCFGSIIPLFMT